MDHLKKTLFLIAVFSLFIFMQSASPASAQPAGKGKAIFTSAGCVECHSVVRGKANSKGPDLWYAGSKFNPDFLKRWLTEPTIIRPMAYGSITEENKAGHPVLTSPDAAAVAGYLASLKSDKVKALGIKAKRSSRGRVIFEKKLGCYGCHEVRKGRRILGGKSGPSLEDAGRRLRPDWIYAYIEDPLYFNPATRMPLYHKSLNKADVRVLSAYLASLKVRK
ncbi:Cytochrome c, class I [hydrothermal vent metagenome]|uniref:Cytochrome c, class I n=1 Tax=hydrothermal vent metagenome TaxID=652676 RepID=A0A3B0VFG9_9ZZZZ